MATSICPVCLAVLPNTRERNAHMGAEHPGTSLTWAGNVATVTGPDGTKTLTRRDFRTLREQARAATPPAEPGGEPTPPIVTGGTTPPRIATGAPRVEQVQGRRVMSRAAVAEAFSREQFADLLREISQILSDADGAGPAGVFSISEATLIAGLLHDQVVDLIIARFDGDVTRFRAGAAILIILVGKGRVHIMAIQARGGAKGFLAAPAPRRPIATVAPELPVAPAGPAPAAPWETVTVAPPPTVTIAPEPPPAPVAPEPTPEPVATGPVLDRPSAVDRIFG